MIKKLIQHLYGVAKKTSSEIIQNTRNVTDFKSYDNNSKIQYEAFELGKKIGVELYHMDYDYYSGSISKNERYGIALSTRKKYSHAPFFFVSVSGVSEANDGVYGDISASVSGVKENTDKTYDFLCIFEQCIYSGKETRGIRYVLRDDCIKIRRDIMGKYVILTNGEGEQVFPATTASQVSFDGSKNMKQVMDEGRVQTLSGGYRRMFYYYALVKN